MKNDRFLLGILIGIVVLIFAALAVFFTRKETLVYTSDSTPQGVVQNYIVAVYKRDYAKAYTYLADLPDKPTIDFFTNSFLNHSVDPGKTGVDIGKADIVGSTGSVEIVIIYNTSDPFSTGYRNTEYAQLTLQNGAWKLKQLPGNYWGYNWYQPNSPEK